MKRDVKYARPSAGAEVGASERTRRQGLGRPVSRKGFALACLCLLVACACLLDGCKESDAIVERIYDQSSTNVDYDNPEKIYIPDDESADDADDQELQTEDAQPWEEVVVNDLPDAVGSEQAAPVPMTEYSANAAAATVAPQASAGEGVKRDDTLGGSDAGDDSFVDAPDPTPLPNDALPQGSGGDGGNNQGGEQGENNEQPGTNEGVKPADPNDDTYLDRVYDSTYGDVEDLPADVRTIAATGELATIAQVVGQAGTLAGSSKEYLANDVIREVFDGKGVKSAKALWAGDGAQTTRADAEAIIKANPDACLVFSGQLGADLERLILQNRPEMRIITLPKPTSAKNIATEVQAVGRMLSDATQGESEQRARAYLDFADAVVAQAEDAHGGGVVSYGGLDYNNNDSTRLLVADDPASVQLWTLYISDWDDDATVTARYENSTLFTDAGVAYTHTGWSWSPLSYYMSAGGVINNAAAFGPLSTQLVQPVLTLNQNQVTYSWKNLDIDVDETRGGGGYSRYRAFYTLTNGRDAVDRGGMNPNDLHQLGSDDFNTLIVKNTHIAQALEKAFQNENGLYTRYLYETTASGSGYGRKYEGTRGESIVYSTVKGDAPVRILVNPCGYVGSWTDGSIEAPLEALWIANQFWGLDDQALNDRVVEFYQTFYDGYVPDVARILDGSYADE